ncbi:MAG: diacylglycerol kinase family lipid kinase [Acidobacteria bacterium]|nr:diacylglycerol kinase family lipid kinase [Acidobacteriota bacterium]
MRLAVLYNPAAGRGRARLHVGEAEGMLRAAGAEVLHYESKSREHMIEMARQLTPENCDRAVVCGGDGSFHLALRGLDLRIPLAVLPLGSGDDFAKTIGVPSRLELACDTVVNGVIREIDVGVANGLRYIGVAGVGFDSVVAARANRVKYLRGSLVYLYSIFSVLPSFKAVPMTIAIDGVAETEEVMFAVVGNTHRYGAGVLIAPAAKVDDGLLDLYVIGKCGMWDLLTTLPKAYTGKHVNSPFVRSARGRAMRIETATPMEVYADGEPLTSTPVEISIAPEKLKIIVPRG